MTASAENGEQLLAEAREDMEVVREGEGGELYVDANISVGQLAANDVFVRSKGEVCRYADADIVGDARVIISTAVVLSAKSRGRI